MEILLLILLYALSQSSDFPGSMRPIMDNLKNSEDILKFLQDLSRFSELFSSPQHPDGHDKEPPPPKDKQEEKDREEKQEKEKSPTSGFADRFIEECLEKYFKKH